MRSVGNSGRGRCMYYAYAISLMYHFKSLGRDHELPGQIFDLLRQQGLSDDERDALTDILRPIQV